MSKRSCLCECRSLWLTLFVATLALGASIGGKATAQDDARAVLLEDNFDVSPWLDSGRRNPAMPMVLDGALDRSKLADRGLDSFDLEDVSGGQHVVVRWNPSYPQLLLRLKVGPNRDAIIAASEPEGYLRCRLLGLENTRIYVWVGGRKHSLQELTEYEMSTSFEYASMLGKYDVVGDVLVEVHPVNEGQPYSGALALLAYRVEGSSKNRENADKHVTIANMTEGYRGEISVAHDTTETVELAGVVGEPLCFSVKFDQPVDNAMVTAELPCDDVRVRWLAKWKTFLLNDPSLGGGGGELDAGSMVPIRAGGDDSATEKAWISFLVRQTDTAPPLLEMRRVGITPTRTPYSTKKTLRSQRSGRTGMSQGLAPIGTLAPSSGALNEQGALDAPAPTPEGVVTGTVVVSNAEGPINRINVRITAYPFPLVDQGAVRSGIYVANKRYDEKYWDDIHAWMGRARIEWATNPVAVPMRFIPPSQDQTGRPYQQDAMYRCFQSRRAHGAPERDQMAMILGYELWRFLYGPAEDKYNIDGWIGQSVAGKIQFSRQQFGNDGINNVWVFSFDEATDDKLRKLPPLWQVARASGGRVCAAIHASSWEVPEVRENIDFWVMTERNYRFSQKLRSYNKLSAKYGYPFTDVHGYDVHRLEFMKCLYSGVDFYFNYALNDINGATFDGSRKMCLVVPTDGGLIETGSSEGFIRGVYDMKYIATLKGLADEALRQNPNNTAAREALDYIDMLNPKVDCNVMKTELAQRIQALSGS